ncbi:MAG: beta-ketoacyl synthase [Gammaproteobacteria bacterium]|nr:beta-ketoacyl synthase [Gammaproteobacteria bacterium]
MKLPVIVAMGGMNAAGRTSGFHAYKRMVYQSLSDAAMADTWEDLAHRMHLIDDQGHYDLNAILKGTLVRHIDLFDPNRVQIQQAVKVKEAFDLKASYLEGDLDDLLFLEGQSFFVKKHAALEVQSAGLCPKGFNPMRLYSSRHHPRGLALTIYGMSDALSSLGIAWQTVLSKVHPDEISVYAGSALAQIDESSLAGLIGMPLRGSRVSSKMMPLSLAEMPADFVNSYVINSVGTTGHNMGACATFLYNLRLGVRDIQSGQAKVVIVGSAEAPVQPDVIAGFNAMGALATDESLRKLDNVEKANHRRACRPFSTNTGFVISESSQFVILMADDLALELGATILGSVPDVYVNADGNKKSIASPGVGNYITMAKTAALAKSILGGKGLNRTYVQAHGTGTPQNRVTESHIMNEVAKTFGIEDWKVTAVKSYIGHSIGVAAGDQLMATLGAWQWGIIPGIQTIDHIADDVYHDSLNILMNHYECEHHNEMLGTIINSKGFGGNNASALILSPQQTKEMLMHKYGASTLKEYISKNEPIVEKKNTNDKKACEGQETLVYHFGTEVLEMDDIVMTQDQIKLNKFPTAIDLPQDTPYISYLGE